MAIINGINGWEFNGELAADFLPGTTDTYDLGSTSKRWQDLYLSGDIHLQRTKKLDFHDGGEYLSSPADSKLDIVSGGRVSIGTGDGDHSLASTGDLVVGGKIEVDGISYFDAVTEHAANIKLLGSMLDVSIAGDSVVGVSGEHIYSDLADTMRFRAGANLVFSMQGGASFSHKPLRVPEGLVSALGLTFLADVDTGIYSVGADILGIAAGGLQAGAFEDPADLATGETSLWIYDDDDDAVLQVLVGAADSGGAGFRMLRIANVT